MNLDLSDHTAPANSDDMSYSSKMIKVLSPTETVRTETMGDSFFQSFSNLGSGNNSDSNIAASFQIDLENSISNLLDAPWNEDYSPRPTIRNNASSSTTSPPPGVSRLDFLQDSLTSLRLDAPYSDDDSSSVSSGSMEASLTLLEATSEDLPTHRLPGISGMRNNQYFSASSPQIFMGNPAGYPNPTSPFLKKNSKSLSAIAENSDETILIAMLRRQIKTLNRQISEQKAQNRQTFSQQIHMATIPEKVDSSETESIWNVVGDAEDKHSPIVSIDDILKKLESVRGGDNEVKSQLKSSLLNLQMLQHEEFTKRAALHRKELDESQLRIADLESQLRHVPER